MAAVTPQTICVRCHADALKCFGEPHVTGGCFSRCIPVAGYCEHCDASIAEKIVNRVVEDAVVYKPVYVSLRVCTGMRAIADKHFASGAMGQKYSNYFAGVVSFLTAEFSDARVQFHALQLLPYAFYEEFAKPSLSWTEFLITGSSRSLWSYVGPRPAVAAHAGADGGTPPGDDPDDGEDAPDTDATDAQRLNDEAHVNGGTRQGITVPETASDDLNRVTEVTGDISMTENQHRVAHTRGPHLATTPIFVMDNTPLNAIEGEQQRNYKIGDFKPNEFDLRSFEASQEAIMKYVFNKTNLRDAWAKFPGIKECYPTKYQKSLVDQLLSENLSAQAADWPDTLTVMVKAEVSAKQKPRLVVDHGFRRLAALAAVGHIYDDLLFTHFKYASIKHRSKRQALLDIANNLKDVRGECQAFENDLTSFEYGISQPLKEAEAKIFTAIVQACPYLAANELDAMEIARVIEERTKPMVWKMRFKRDDGQFGVIKLRLNKVIRESGDRFTSSGNWLQNYFAWTTFLISDTDMDGAIRRWVAKKGKSFPYESRRDGERHHAALAFEGDDTLGRLNEKIDGDVEAFFERWGWRPKLKYAVPDADGYAAVTFVGYECLLKDGKPVIDQGELVCTPELKRFLKTKMWTTMQGTEEEIRQSTNIYAKSMAQEFRHLQPLYAFCAAMAADTEGDCSEKGNAFRNTARDLYLRDHGELAPTEVMNRYASRLQMPESAFSDEYKHLARLTGGSFSSEEWASMCAITTLKMHGDEARNLIPASWLS